MTPEEAVRAASELLRQWLPATKRYNGRDFFLGFEFYSLLTPATGFDKLVKLVKEARTGDADANSLLQRLGGLFVTSGVALPEPLRGYIADSLQKKINAGPSRRGKHRQAGLPRNFVVMYVVARVADHGFHPTRNREQKTHESACSIVAEALERVGVHIEETSVEKIWEGRSRLPKDLREYIEGKARVPASPFALGPASEN
jgi:hypothetical protein